MKKSEKMRKRAARAEIFERKFKEFKESVEWVIDHKEDVLSDKKLYVKELPHFASGSSYAGPVPFTVGVMLECWDNCPEFTLSDGSQICNWGCGVSGWISGMSYNARTNDLRSYDSYNAGGLRFGNLMPNALPYLRKAKAIMAELEKSQKEE